MFGGHITFLRVSSAVANDNRRAAVLFLVIRTCAAPREAAAFACGRCLNGAGRAAELPVQPAVEFLPPLQFPRFRPRFPAVVFAYRAKKHGHTVQPLLFKSCSNGILLEFVGKQQSKMDGSSARAQRVDVGIQGDQVGQYGVRGDGVAVRQGNAAVLGV